MFVYLPLLIALVGLIIYFAATTNAKLAETGRLLFFAGVLAYLLGVK